jgi:hypothetical protein
MVTVRLPAAGFSAALAAMREWLDRNRYEPTKFNYDQDDEAVVLSVEFPNDQEAEAFAGRFDRKEPPGLTPLGVWQRPLQGRDCHATLVPGRERRTPLGHLSLGLVGSLGQLNCPHPKPLDNLCSGYAPCEKELT